MHHKTHQEIEAEAAERLAAVIPAALSRYERRELAAETVRAEINAMEVAGKVLKLTDEELLLLRSFRDFVAGMKKAGAVFKWQTTPKEAIDGK